MLCVIETANPTTLVIPGWWLVEQSKIFNYTSTSSQPIISPFILNRLVSMLQEILYEKAFCH